MKKGLLIVFVLAISSIFCSAEPVMAESPYEGSYKGTFSGNFDGQWTCIVGSNGQINDWTISLAPGAKGKGEIDKDGNLIVKLNPGGMETVWTAKVTKDLKVTNGKLNLGGTFKGQGTREQAAAKSEPAIKVILLGTGIPVPNPQRACASTLVVAGDKTFLIDTGRGFLNNLFKAGARGASAVLFTHFHSDHFGEFGELMVIRGITGADNPLKVIGPKGTGKVVNGILDAYSLDFAYRKAHHKDKWPDASFKVDVQEVDTGVVYDKDGIKIRMFKVDHSPIEPAVGYRIDYKGRSVVVSGDTRKIPEMIDMAKGCDILVHEALNSQLVKMGEARVKNSPRLLGMNQEMAEYHATTLEVAEIARDAGVGKLVLTHLVPSIPPNDQMEKTFIKGMSDIYKGTIFVGRDGMIIETGPAK